MKNKDDTIYWRVCPSCQKSDMREAILNWANHLEGKLVIIIKCKECNK